MQSILRKIRTHYNTLSKHQKVVGDYILNNSESVILQSITDLAANCNTSETTVMRFLKKLNYDSYQVFRVVLAKELSGSPHETINEAIRGDDDLETIKKKVISHSSTAINDLSFSLKEEVLESALALLSSAERVFFYGVGASSAIAIDAMHKFSKIGFEVFGYPDPHMMNIVCSHATPQDVMFAVSHTGESIEVLNAVSLVKKRGGKIISVTSFKNSSLAKQADVLLSSSTNGQKYHTEAMASRIVQLTIVDILYLATFIRNERIYDDPLNNSRLAVSLNKR
jgi:DNA-binding MurR/RpiR family transcriptional regulator